MKTLQQQIKQLELEMNIDNNFIKQKNLLLRSQITTPVLSLAILTSFTCGYLLARNKTGTQLMYGLAVMPLKIRRVAKKIKLFLSAIPL